MTGPVVRSWIFILCSLYFINSSGATVVRSFALKQKGLACMGSLWVLFVFGSKYVHVRIFGDSILDVGVNVNIGGCLPLHDSPGCTCITLWRRKEESEWINGNGFISNFIANIKSTRSLNGMIRQSSVEGGWRVFLGLSSQFINVKAWWDGTVTANYFQAKVCWSLVEAHLVLKDGLKQ